ncbi:hypothetical protein EF294_07300 [Gordonia oryzae]|uniref:Mycobacterium membrane protein n=1 Tax=Gordonia oryzae TaxID=2487349 RepID=A0A3N4HES0_9ACTN|nr:hypothetical protein [Gordonia oryzae]RPA64884.1 hypothetical protein EF294_07300 [Gordonia oryzae]
MGQPTGQRPDGADDYRTPLLPGNYPPLGYSDRGLPRYTAADLAAGGRPQTASRHHVGPVTLSDGLDGDEMGTAGTDAEPPHHPRRSGEERGVGATVVISAVVGLMIVGLAVVGVRSLHHQQNPTITLPSAEPTAIYSLPVLPTRPGLPTPPGGDQPGGGSGDGSGTTPGAQVTYTVTINGVGTILYIDDVGVRTDFTPSSNWTVTFAASRNPLRLVVVAGDGSSVHCTITVAGRPVADDSVEISSTRRTATCIA